MIVGGGLAAARTAEQLRRADYPGPLMIVSDEVYLPYDRPPLSKEVLRRELDDVALKPREWYDEHNITLRLGAAATSLVFDEEALSFIVTAANGLPYVATLLGHYAALAALDSQRTRVVAPDVSNGVTEALSELMDRMSKRSQVQIGV